MDLGYVYYDKDALSIQMSSFLVESAKNSKLKNAPYWRIFAPLRTFKLVILNISQIHLTPDFPLV